MLLKLVDILHFYITQGIHQQFNGGRRPNASGFFVDITEQWNCSKVNVYIEVTDCYIFS